MDIRNKNPVCSGYWLKCNYIICKCDCWVISFIDLFGYSGHEVVAVTCVKLGRNPVFITVCKDSFVSDVNKERCSLIHLYFWIYNDTDLVKRKIGSHDLEFSGTVVDYTWSAYYISSVNILVGTAIHHVYTCHALLEPFLFCDIIRVFGWFWGFKNFSGLGCDIWSVFAIRIETIICVHYCG